MDAVQILFFSKILISDIGFKFVVCYKSRENINKETKLGGVKSLV